MMAESGDGPRAIYRQKGELKEGRPSSDERVNEEAMATGSGGGRSEGGGPPACGPNGEWASSSAK